jgi:hypothetical protein
MFEVFASNPQFLPPKAGSAGLDGIAFAGDGNLYVTTYAAGGLFRALPPGRRRRDLGSGGNRRRRIQSGAHTRRVRTPTSVTRVGSTAWVSEGKCAERSRLPLVDSIGWTECFYLPGYYSSSSSQFTSGGAENPTLTIVALAIRQAEYLADQLSKKEM